jgi:hypothetical protein
LTTSICRAGAYTASISAGLRLTHANLAGASIGDSRYEGMTIDGIPVTAMIAAYKAAQAGRTDG